MAENPITPQTLPAEFPEQLSAEMLMVPDSEFLLARWAFSAQLAAQMKGEDGFDLAMHQLREGRLGAMGSPGNIDQAMSGGMGGPLLLSMGMTYPDMIKMVKEAVAPGQVIKIDRPRFIDGATTESKRKMSPTTKLFGNSQGIGMDQVDVTVVEYTGPGDSNGDPVPISLARFAQHRAKHDLLKLVGNELRRDWNKFVDDLLYTRLIDAAGATSDGITRAGDVTANNAFSGVDNEPADYRMIVKATEAQRGRKVPGVGGSGRYIYIADHHIGSQLKLDPTIQRLAVFMPEWNALLPGYFTTIEDVHIVISNRMPRLTDLGPSSNIAGYQGLLVAPGAIGWACAEDVRVLRDRNDDGGRFAAFGWSHYGGFQILDDRFVQKTIST